MPSSGAASTCIFVARGLGIVREGGEAHNLWELPDYLQVANVHLHPRECLILQHWGPSTSLIFRQAFKVFVTQAPKLELVRVSNPDTCIVPGV